MSHSRGDEEIFESVGSDTEKMFVDNNVRY